MAAAFGLLSREISYSGERISEALCICGNRLGGRLGEVWENIGEEALLREQSTEEIWARQMGEYVENSSLSEEERKKAVSFSAWMGFLDREAQIHAMKEFSDWFWGAAAQQERELSEKKKLIMSLCVSGGLMAAILLL